MSAPNVYLVVMAGGSGTRFWPKSTSGRPKQLLSFGQGGTTLLEQTFARFEDWVPEKNGFVVTTRKLEKAVREIVSSQVTVLAEPEGRNTAPCVYWASRAIYEKDPSAVLMVMPSDHYIAQPDRFLKTVKDAVRWASENRDLVTLGVQPTRPETGYGYLRTGQKKGSDATIVEAFVEKPDLEKAKKFLAGGNYLWNGGMFIWRADVIMEAFDRFMPEMRKTWDQHHGNVEQAYPKMTATSIDFGVMEKASNVMTFPLECGWDDLGSWVSLDNLADVLRARHEAGTVTSGELLSVDASRNIIDVPGKTVALLGVEDLIIVQQGEVLMVAHKDRAQDIRKLVEQVRTRRPDLA